MKGTVKVGDEVYSYLLIKDDTGCRVEVHPQSSFVTGSGQPVVKEYIAEGMGEDELKKKIFSWILAYQEA